MSRGIMINGVAGTGKTTLNDLSADMLNPTELLLRADDIHALGKL